MASSVVFHIRLYQLNSHLRSFYPQIWRVFGSGNENLGVVGRYNRMTQLSTQYEVNDEELNNKLIILRRLHQSAGLGAAIALLGFIIDVFFRT
jgi:hypothetical protein